MEKGTKQLKLSFLQILSIYFADIHIYIQIYIRNAYIQTNLA